MTATTAYLLYFVFALGGVGIYFLLPQGDKRSPVTGAIFAVMALIALLLVLCFQVVSPGGSSAYFYLFSSIAMGAAARVITHRKPVYSAVYFVLLAVAVAALLVLLRAEFLAVALIIIYAGAILVTYLFVIMLAQQSHSPIYDRRAREPFLAVFAGFLLTAAIAGRVGDFTATPQLERPDHHANVATLLKNYEDTGEAPLSNTLAIGQTVMTRYVVVLELAGVLLLVSMIGAVAMSRKKVPVEGHQSLTKPIGQIGREVKPF